MDFGRATITIDTMRTKPFNMSAIIIDTAPTPLRSMENRFALMPRQRSLTPRSALTKMSDHNPTELGAKNMTTNRSKSRHQRHISITTILTMIRPKPSRTHVAKLTDTARVSRIVTR